MEQQHKELYEAPTTELVEVQTENNILQGSVTLEDYDAIEW